MTDYNRNSDALTIKEAAGRAMQIIAIASGRRAEVLAEDLKEDALVAIASGHLTGDDAVTAALLALSTRQLSEVAREHIASGVPDGHPLRDGVAAEWSWYKDDKEMTVWVSPSADFVRDYA
jgi:hypothetical protein